MPRRSAADVLRIVDAIVELVKQHPEGLRAEQIRAHLGLEAKELARPLNEGIRGGRLTKSGKKRATTYVAKSPARRSATKAKRARRSATAGAAKNQHSVRAGGAALGVAGEAGQAGQAGPSVQSGAVGEPAVAASTEATVA